MLAMQYAKVKSNPKQSSCKKSVKKTIVKKICNPRWWPRNSCDGRLMVNISIAIFQV